MNTINITLRESYATPVAEEVNLNNLQSLLVSLSIKGEIEDFEEGEEL